MPNWKEVLSKIQATGSAHDVVRREAIRALSEETKRNVIVYYSRGAAVRRRALSLPCPVVRWPHA